MDCYLIEIKNLKDLCTYITFLEAFVFEGEIYVDGEMLDAGDVLLLCEKCISKKVCLRAAESDECKKEAILEYLTKNKLLVSVRKEVFMDYEIRLKRIYLPFEPTDGHRILVDRLWPRGIAKEKAKIECWHKEVAPSSVLRNRFHRGEVSYVQFRQLYMDELESNPEAGMFVEECRKWQAAGSITLLFGAKDEEQNNAVVLRDWIVKKLEGIKTQK